MAIVTDTIADMLTRIRNANAMRYEEVIIPSSKLKLEIANIFKNEGYISNFELVDEDKVEKNIKITLKYNNKERVINGLGTAIISTSQGLMTDKEARSKNLGGEVLLYIW